MVSRAIFMISLALLLGAATSNLQDDIVRCGEAIGNLQSNCNAFVFGGKGKSPTTGCCSMLNTQFNATKNCLCTFVKDVKDPNFPVKGINGTLLLSLPTKCAISYDPLECLDLLHLSSDSAEAQVFVDYSNSLQTNTSPASGPSSISSNNSVRSQNPTTEVLLLVLVLLASFLFM